MGVFIVFPIWDQLWTCSLRPGKLLQLPSDTFFSLVVFFIVYPANKKKALLLPQVYLSIQNPLKGALHMFWSAEVHHYLVVTSLTTELSG